MRVGATVSSALLKSKSYKLDGTLGCTKYIKNPGKLAKFASGTTKTLGILSVAGLGLGIADNYLNYENAWARTKVDIGAFAVGVVAGIAIGGMLGTGGLGIAVTIAAGFAITAVANGIKDQNYSEPKRRR